MGYKGRMVVPDDKRELFTEQMMKVFYYGGMMSFDDVKLYGHEISLLCPVKKTYGKEVRFHYNYFQDNAWETVEYDEKGNRLWSGKVSSNEFLDVMAAAYMLYELYSDEAGAVMVDGDILDGGEAVGWLNQILKTEFTREKRLDRLWELGEKLGLESADGDYDAPDVRKIMELIPEGLRFAAGGTDLADLIYIANGTECLCGKEPDGTYPAEVYHCKMALRKYFEKKGESGIDDLWALVKMEWKEREAVTDPAWKEIVGYTEFLPARVIVFLTAELIGREFWKEWAKLREHVYHDEMRKVYAAPEILKFREKKRREPAAPLRTSDFLRQDGFFAFFDTPKELKGRSNYYISDADRLYWWDGSDEVEIPEETDQWLRKLGERYRKLLEVQETENVDFLEYFFGLLEQINEFYKRVFPFQEMFYDFLQNDSRREYRAALKLLEELDQENREDGRIIEKLSGSWDLNSYNVTHNAGRMRMKRYLAVLANRGLREMYFGF